MNRTYKVIWSKARHCYVVVSELTKSQHKSSSKSELISTNVHRGYFGKAAVAAIVAGLLTFGGVAYSPVLAADKDIVKGDGAEKIKYDISPTNDGTNIAVGKNAKVFIGGGTQESMLSFGEKAERTYTQIDVPIIGSITIPTGWHIHSNEHAKKNLPEAIAIGTNSYARTGSIEIGAHTLAENQIAIGDTTADKLRQFGVASTTLGTNSYTGGGFATTIGSYNVQTNQYEAKDSDDTLNNATKNAFATVIGTFNSNESLSSDDVYTGSVAGVANMISGTANKVTNSNGAIVMGAGNSVKDSIASFDTAAYSSVFKSATEMQKFLMEGVAKSAGGATLVIGGANSAEKTQNSQIMGVGNSMKSTTDEKIQYNYLDGFNNSITDASHVKVLGQGVTINKGADSNTVIGDYRAVAEGQTHNVIIGNADETAPITTEKKDTVILGHNANATIDGGVAIGSGSIANVEKGQKGYYVKHDQRSEEGQGYPFKNNDSAWISRAGAVSVGDTTNEDQSKWITRQITGVAAGTKDTDAVNVAQLKAISNTVDASKTKYYSVNDSAPGAIFDNEEFEKHYTNKNNDGAKSYYAMAAGYGTYAAGDASTVIGSYSVIQNDKVKDGDDEDLSPQGATAVSVGSFNFNLNTPIKSSNDFSKWYSGTANSIVGQGNLTKDSNGVLIYGAGNKITNSYRGDVPINMLAASMNSDVYQNPESFTDKVGEAVLQSGGQVMAIGGGNVADKAYMTQLMGVGNKVQGADITFTPPELQDDEENYERYITAFNSAFNKQATRLNYVDGFYNNLTNAKNDYVIGMANDISGDDVSSNKSNIVIGDFHQMKNGSNNIILGSQDGKLTQKRYNTDGTLGTKESVNRFTHQEKLADAVMIGHNADVLKNGGVALGADSVASVDKDVVGYDPSGIDHSEDTTGVWKSKAAAVSVGDASKKITRQITNVAAGTQDTDAVNVAQLKAVSSSINTDIAASKTHFYSVKSTDSTAKNYNNDGATGINALAAGVGANAEADHSIAIGTGAWTNEGDGRVKGSGDIAIGHNATIHNYVNQSGSIALGQNALIENTFGSTEKNYAFNQTTFTPYGSGFLPADANKEATGIAIGRNSFARTGSLMVGTHMYKGAIADMNEVDGTNSDTLLNQDFNNVNMTTLGTNSFNNGTFATVTGAYSATTAKKKIQNFAATVDGSLNSIESYKDAADNSGVASSIVGTANRIANSNNTTILGAGNEVTNSLTDITAPTEGGDSAKALQDTLKGKLQQDAKGAVVVSGIGNKVNSSHGVSVLGSRNVVNTTDNIQLLGDNREVTGATGSVIIGSADSKTTTSVTDATILGHNANVEKAGGVALGAGSVASREAGVAGYDPETKEASKNTSATWKATKAAVSVGKADGTMTRQITGVAAGSAATDAVNVAQLQKALAGAKDGNDTLKSDTNALKLDGNTLSMNVEDTAGHKVSGSVDLSKFAQAVDTNTTYTLTGQANQDNTTTITLEDNNGKKNSVTVATKDTRNTVKAGENVTLDTKDNADGSHEYTVNVKADGKVEAGSTKIVSGGTVYNETRVAKDGNFVKQSNTAGENLSALDNQVTANTESIYHMNGRISDLDNRVNKVGAGAAALAALHPLDFDPDDKWDFAVGYGNYRNANSVAFGAFYRPNEDTMFSLGTNFGNGENMFNAGLSFKIGQGGSGITTSKTAMAKKIESLENTVDQQDKKIAELEALVKEQGEMIRQYVGKK